MGILNLTPDSFSDGGKFNTPIILGILLKFKFEKLLFFLIIILRS